MPTDLHLVKGNWELFERRRDQGQLQRNGPRTGEETLKKHSHYLEVQVDHGKKRGFHQVDFFFQERNFHHPNLRTILQIVGLTSRNHRILKVKRFHNLK